MGDEAIASLVIGGTGMLAEATRWLARRYPPTLLVSRHASRFDPMAGAVVPLELDWSQPGFVQSIESRLRAMPPLAKALIWIHRPQAHLAELAPLLPQPGGAVLVLGSRSGRPGAIGVPAGVATVRLGSVPTSDGRRWLTHAEISAAAIAALEDGRSRVVGELAPVNRGCVRGRSVQRGGYMGSKGRSK